MAHNHNLGGGLADFGETGEFGHHLVTAAVGLDHQYVRGRLRLVDLDRCGDAAQLDRHVGAGHAAVTARDLNGLAGFLRLTEDVDVDAGNQRHEFILCGGHLLGSLHCGVHGVALRFSPLLCLCRDRRQKPKIDGTPELD